MLKALRQALKLGEQTLLGIILLLTSSAQAVVVTAPNVVFVATDGATPLTIPNAKINSDYVLGVKVTDSAGAALSSQTVTWKVVSTGTLAGSLASVGIETTTQTDGNGYAQVSYKSGTKVGKNSISAAVTVNGKTKTVRFMFTTISGPEGGTQLVCSSTTNNQAGVPGTALKKAFSVQVKDTYGNLVTGALINWLVTVGNGSLSVSQSATAGTKATATTWFTPAASSTTTYSVTATLDGTSITCPVLAAPKLQFFSGKLAPPAPTGLSAQRSGTSVTLSWSADASGGPALKYRIYRATSNLTAGARGWQLLKLGVTGTSYVDTKATSLPTTYYYYIAGYHAGGSSISSSVSSDSSAMPAGTPDTTFGTQSNGTIVFSDLEGNYVDNVRGSPAIAVQSDGKIIVGGTAHPISDLNTYASWVIKRLNANGSLDTSFGQASSGTQITNFAMYNWLTKILIQPDGKILVGGYVFQDTTTYGDFALARYLSNGQLDTTFGSSGVIIEDVGAMHNRISDFLLQSDGKIVIVGPSFTQQNQYHLTLIRYLSNGTKDTTFGSAGVVHIDQSSDDEWDDYSIARQSDGKYLVSSSTWMNGNGDFKLTRFTSTGALDTTFGTSGEFILDLQSGSTDYLSKVLVQTDDKILLVGDTSSSSGSDWVVARLTNSGVLDTTFGGGTGYLLVDLGSASDYLTDVKLLSSGKLILAGFNLASSYQMAVARINSNGSLDTQFGVSTSGATFFDLNVDTFDFLRSIAIQPDGKIVGAGVTLGSSWTQMAAIRLWN